MAFTDAFVNFFGITEVGVIEWRRTRQIWDEATSPRELVAERHVRTTLEPGQDVSALPPRVRGLCNFVWTPAVVTAYLAAKAANAGR